MQPQDTVPFHFIDEPIEVWFETPSSLEKKPACPSGFIWQGESYSVVIVLAEWVDFRRRGRMARNMAPAHAETASRRGSWGVGRYYFRVQVETGAIYDIYYDRAPESASDRKGHWFLLGERQLDA